MPHELVGPSEPPGARLALRVAPEVQRQPLPRQFVPEIASLVEGWRQPSRLKHPEEQPSAGITWKFSAAATTTIHEKGIN